MPRRSGRVAEKSQAEEVEDKEADEEQNEQEGEELSETAAEEPPRKKQKKSTKKRAAPKVSKKKAKVDDETSNKEPEETGDGEGEKPAAKKKKSAKKGESKKVSNLSLFDSVAKKGSALSLTVDGWLERYEKNRAEAMLELVNFLIRACGSEGHINLESYEADDVESIIKEIADTIDKSGYPILGGSSKDSVSGFKPRLEEFWEKLVSKSKNSVLFDDVMMDAVIRWVVGLSSSTVRALRHTATVAGLSIMSALIQVAVGVSDELAKATRQVETEKKRKQKDTAAIKRVTDLAESASSRKTDLDNWIQNKLFNGLFVHRYRDSNAEIRTLCIQCLGQWIEAYPPVFLDDVYLKYLGWTLFDKLPDVRRASIDALKKLYADKDLTHQLGLFTQRFKERMKEMAKDNNDKVAADAIKLSSELLDVGLLEQADIDYMYQFIGVENRRMRNCAAEFVYKHLFDQVIEAQLKEEAGSDRSDMQLRGTVQLIVEYSELKDNPTYIIDSLWKLAKCLKDWDGMVALLLAEDEGDAALNDAEQKTLASVLNLTVKKASGKPLLPKEKPTVPEPEDVAKITKAIAKKLPALLTRYQADGDIVANLIELPQFYSMDVINEEHLKKPFTATLKQFSELAFMHNKKDVFQALASTYKSLLSRDFPLKTSVEEAYQALVGEIVSKAVEAANTIDDDDETQYPVATAFSRLREFTARFDCSSTDAGEGEGLIEAVSNVIERQVKRKKVRAEIAIDAIETVIISLAWMRRGINDAKPNRKAAELLCGYRDNFVSQLSRILTDARDIDIAGVTGHAFRALNTIGHLFSPHSSPPALSLVLDAPTQVEMVSYLDRVLDEYQRTIETEGETMDEQELMGMYDGTMEVVKAIARSFSAGVVERGYAGKALVHMLEHDKVFFEPLKGMLKRMRQQSRDQEYEIVLSALREKFQSYTRENRDAEHRQGLKLARYFALSYGVQYNTYLKSLQHLVEQGVTFALSDAPRNIPFLDYIQHFVARFAEENRKATAEYFEMVTSKVEPVKKSPQWDAFFAFRSYLQTGKTSVVTGPKKPARKSVGDDEDGDDVTRKLAMDSDSDQDDLLPQTKRRRSTLQRRLSAVGAARDNASAGDNASAAPDDESEAGDGLFKSQNSQRASTGGARASTYKSHAGTKRKRGEDEDAPMLGRGVVKETKRPAGGRKAAAKPKSKKAAAESEPAPGPSSASKMASQMRPRGSATPRSSAATPRETQAEAEAEAEEEEEEAAAAPSQQRSSPRRSRKAIVDSAEDALDAAAQKRGAHEESEDDAELLQNPFEKGGTRTSYRSSVASAPAPAPAKGRKRGLSPSGAGSASQEVSSPKRRRK